VKGGEEELGRTKNKALYAKLNRTYMGTTRRMEYDILIGPVHDREGIKRNTRKRRCAVYSRKKEKKKKKKKRGRRRKL